MGIFSVLTWPSSVVCCDVDTQVGFFDAQCRQFYSIVSLERIVETAGNAGNASNKF